MVYGVRAAGKRFSVHRVTSHAAAVTRMRTSSKVVGNGPMRHRTT